MVKDVEIEQIVARFLEEIHLRACAEHRDLFHRRGMVVSQVEASSTDNASLILDDAGMVPDSHRFRLELPLPQTLKVCRQSVTQDRIRITHNLEVRLRIRSKFGVVDSVSRVKFASIPMAQLIAADITEVPIPSQYALREFLPWQRC